MQELEEEHEYLNEELKRVNAENRNLLEKLQHLQAQLGGNSEANSSTQKVNIECISLDTKSWLGPEITGEKRVSLETELEQRNSLNHAFNIHIY